MADDPDETDSGIRPTALPPEQAEELESILRSEGLGPPQAATAVRVFQSFRSHRGPLPSAEEFEAYESVFPGAAKEILEMAVRQQEHIHYCEKSAINGELNYRMFGMISAVIVVLVLVIGAIVCSIYGQTAVACTLGGAAGLTTLAGAFIKGRRLFDLSPQISPESPLSTIKPKRR